MPRIAQKEIHVNIQMKMQLENPSDKRGSADALIVFDPEWGSVCIDPETGKKAKLYDHVPRNMKFSGGIQIWIMVPRYLLEGGGLFRVLPLNLSINKHYVTEEIQDAVDDAIEMLLEAEKPSSEEQIQQQLEGSNDATDRPCGRTKRLWMLWFFKNLLLIESNLRTIHFMSAEMTGAGESTFSDILARSDYLLELRLQEPDDWLKTVIQTAWNSGRPLIPLKDCQTMREVLAWITITPISNN